MKHEPLEEYKVDLKELNLELPKDKVFKKICCPSCNADVPAENLNINDKIAKCGSCDVVFPFQDDIAHFDKTPRKVKQEILRPEGIELFYYKGELDISFIQPYNWAEIIWFIIVGFITFVSVPIMIKESVKLSLVPLILAPAIVTLIYLIRHYQKHKIHLVVGDRFLHIQRRPKKLVKDKSYRVQDIDQLYIKKRSDANIWNIYMITDSGSGQKHVKLTSVSSVSKAKFLEQEIENHLNIQDREVPEEDK